MLGALLQRAGKRAQLALLAQLRADGRQDQEQAGAQRHDEAGDGRRKQAAHDRRLAVADPCEDRHGDCMRLDGTGDRNDDRSQIKPDRKLCLGDLHRPPDFPILPHGN